MASNTLTADSFHLQSHVSKHMNPGKVSVMQEVRNIPFNTNHLTLFINRIKNTQNSMAIVLYHIML